MWRWRVASKDVKLVLRFSSSRTGSAQYFLRASQSGLSPCSFVRCGSYSASQPPYLHEIHRLRGAVCEGQSPFEGELRFGPHSDFGERRAAPARPLPHQTPDILPTFLFLRQSTSVASPLLRRAVSCLF
jgi:hypothetical protein